MINKRKQEAEKSMVVQVNSEKSYPELYNYCSQFGTIESAFHYKVRDEQLHFILLEYDSVAGCEEALRKCTFNQDKPGVPVSSPFTWFKATKSSKKVKETKDFPKLKEEETRAVDEAELFESLSTAENMNDQILILYRLTKLNDLGNRLRYMAGRQLEMAISGMFPNAQACLFGSSVNGFGKKGCDVDLILRLNNKHAKSEVESRLIYQTKVSNASERTYIQRQMEIIGDIMHFFLPAINNVRKILNARVPIIKYNHECLDLEIDFSMNNLSGFYMSELLYIYGELDERVRPLVFCIRKWASSIGLTNSTSPGRWITNFPLTVLILFFLQTLQKPILPPFNLLIRSATPQDIRVTDDFINCTFLRDLKKLQFRTDNEDSVQILLKQFFEFYSKFNFHENGISLIEGTAVLKPDYSAMWITNPLEPLLNVSKNLSHEELEKLKFEAKNAAWIMETLEGKKSEGDWGLMTLLRARKKIVKAESFFKPRIVDVQDLFSVSEEKESKEDVEYKNPFIKDAVKQIHKETQRKISKLRKTS